MSKAIQVLCVVLLSCLPLAFAGCNVFVQSKSISDSQSEETHAFVEAAVIVKVAIEDLLDSNGTCTQDEVSAIVDLQATAYATAVAKGSSFTQATVEGDPDCGYAKATSTTISQATAKAIAGAQSLAIAQVFGIGFSIADNEALATDIATATAETESRIVQVGSGFAINYAEAEAVAVAKAVARALSEAVVRIYGCTP